jgi:hypothetical protein
MYHVVVKDHGLYADIYSNVGLNHVREYRVATDPNFRAMRREMKSLNTVYTTDMSAK